MMIHKTRMCAAAMILGNIPGSGFVEDIFSNDYFKEYLAQFIVAISSQFVSAAISILIDYLFYGGNVPA